MIRRLFKTGNSIVVSIPREILDGLNLDDGNSLSLEMDQEHQRIVLTPVDKPVAIAGVNENFAHQVNEFISHYRTALEELAK
jgi:putative addiction module antidote